MRGEFRISLCHQGFENGMGNQSHRTTLRSKTGVLRCAQRVMDGLMLFETVFGESLKQKNSMSANAKRSESCVSRSDRLNGR